MRSRFRPKTGWAGLAVVVSLTALVVPSTAGAQSAHTAPALHPAKRLSGVVRDLPAGASVAPTAHIANLPYGGGPVLHSNRTHLIFWQPSGSGLGYEPGYASAFETFLSRVAADSHRPSNVYGLSGQYADASGPAAYDTRYGGSVLAADPLPANGCAEPTGGPGWSRCLSDSQLADEIEQVVIAHRLPTTWKDIYFLALPAGLATCEDAGPDNCALGGDASGGYCGYHSTTMDSRIRYAVIPYNAVSGHCQSGTPRPNGGSVDPSLSTLSHEHNEVVTDPLGNGWVDSDGNENGDLCIARYGPPVGGSGVAAWNEVIHGGHYYLQEEWSNLDHGCQPRAPADRLSFSAPARVGARERLTFRARARAVHGSIVAYAWFFGQGPIGRRRVSSHTFSRPGVSRVVLRSTDSAGNWAFYSRVITVTGGPGTRAGRGANRG